MKETKQAALAMTVRSRSEHIDSGAHLTKTNGVLVWLGFAKCSEFVEHALRQGLVHVFGDWNDGHRSVKVAEIPLHFPVEFRRAREADAAEHGIAMYHALNSASVVKIAPSIDISTSSSGSWLISWPPRDSSHLHAEKVSAACIENYYQQLHDVRIQALSMTPLMDACAVSYHRHYQRPR